MLSIVMLLSLTVTAFAAEPESDTPNPAAFTENDGDYIGETHAGSERIVVRGEAWFKACRATYSGYESHYTYNSRLEGSSMGYIYGQATCPNFAIGTEYMADVGCEIAATYNALKLRGRIIPCSSIIRSFEKDGYLMKVLVDRSAGSSYDVYIVSFWNDAIDMFQGLHTVAFDTSASDNVIHVYNYSTKSSTVETKNSFSSFVSGGKFIVGYQIPQLRARSI